MRHINNIARSIPDDFTALAATMTRKALRMHYRCGSATIARWIAHSGVEPMQPPKANNKKKAKTDFVDWELYAHKESAAQLQARYGVSRQTILLQRQITGIKLDRKYIKVASTKPTRPMPDDFATVAPTMLLTAIAEHYVAGMPTVKRWIAESGIKPLPFDRSKASRDARTDMTAYQRTKNVRGIDLRQRTMFDIAADCLRTDKWKVFRCDKSGKPDFNGDWWRVGVKAPMNSEQMLYFALDRSREIRRPDYDWLRCGQDYDGWRGINGWECAA